MKFNNSNQKVSTQLCGKYLYKGKYCLIFINRITPYYYKAKIIVNHMEAVNHYTRSDLKGFLKKKESLPMFQSFDTTKYCVP